MRYFSLIGLLICHVDSTSYWQSGPYIITIRRTPPDSPNRVRFSQIVVKGFGIISYYLIIIHYGLELLNIPEVFSLSFPVVHTQMPLPSEPLTLQGGCNCRAIRYKIDIPTISDRPLHFAGASESHQEKVTLPMIVTDHCNDCRRATGSILPFWICTPISMVSASCIARSDSVDRPEFDVDPTAAKWLPATEIFNPGTASEKTFLTFYESSEGRRRSFCGRCGTNLAYSIFPTPEGWPEMLDVVLGTVDREYLEGHNLAPERQLWWDCGIDWIRRFTTEGACQLAKHPSYEVGDLVR